MYHFGKKQKAVTIIEAIVVLFIASLVITTFYASLTLGMRHIIESKKRLGAVALANKKMEMLRNLSYDSLGTVGGVPAGAIVPDEYVVGGSVRYRVLTDIRFVDDGLDGTLGGAPNDLVPNDYKSVRITARWGAETASEEVFLASRFIPVGLEQSAGGGILVINALDSSGAGVPSVSVHLENSETGVNLDTVTDAAGSAALVGVPSASLNTYEIIMGKNGYETVATLPLPPATPYQPVDIHASVSEGTLTRKDIIINRSSDMHIVFRTPLGDAVPNATASLVGGRILGDDGALPPTPITYTYNYSEDITANVSGEFETDDVSPGNYTFTPTGAAAADFVLYGITPAVYAADNQTAISGGVSQDTAVLLADKTVPSLMVTVSDDAGARIEGVSVRLEDATSGYDTTLTTNARGRVFFPESAAEPLLPGTTYTLTVDGSAANYSTETDTITVTALEQMTIELEPI